MDILINNAGILRDKTFAKMDAAEFDLVVHVHLLGTANFTRAVWAPHARAGLRPHRIHLVGLGRVRQFRQANYGAAKAAMVGLMNVLHLEGAKSNIRVNTLVPSAATEMTKDLLPPAVLALMAPEHVTPAVLFLCGPDAPSRTILSAGAGVFNVTHIQEGPGVFLNEAERTPEGIAAHWAQISTTGGLETVNSALDQTQKFVQIAMRGCGNE